jgi:hypothetical protein
MAQIIRPALADPSLYRGLDWIFEYTNYDGQLQTFNCGQAAIATFLTHHGRMDPVQAPRNMDWLEQHHPPDQFGGWFGTGRKCVERALGAFDVPAVEVAGVDAIREQLDRNNPVMLMVGLPSGKLWGFDLPGGHWMVAFGHEGERVHLTNWSTLTWDEIRSGWNSITSRWIRMSGCGLALPLHS